MPDWLFNSYMPYFKKEFIFALCLEIMRKGREKENVKKNDTINSSFY